MDVGAMQESVLRIVRESDGDAVRIEKVDTEKIAHRVIRETTAGLWRITASVRESAERPLVRRSFVAKRMRADAPGVDPSRRAFLPSKDPSHPNFWRREYDVYGSSLLDALPAPLRAPACFARTLDARFATVWLEDVPHVAPESWSDDRFFIVARALGVWQGTFATRSQAIASPPWLARSSLRMWAPAAGGTAHAAAERDGVFDSQIARSALGPNARDRVLALWRVRDATLAALERAPQTIAHGDFWTRNLLVPNVAHADTVVIDWSELGICPLAHDLVNLVFDSVWMFDVPFERLNALEDAALQGYADGWREGAGIEMRAAICDAYAANARLRFGVLAGTLCAQAANERKRAEMEARYERSFDAIFASRAAVIARVVKSLTEVG